jgi:hypothetical protein
MIQEYDARLPEIEQRLRSIRATRTRQVDIQEKNEREKKELLAEKQNILDQKQNILPRMNMLITDFKFFRTNLQEIYDNNIAAEKQPRIKAEDAYKYFGWFAEHQQELGQKYADELRRAQRPALEIFEEMQREILSRASLQEIPELITPGVKVTPKFRTEEQEEEREKQPDLIPGQTQMPLASFSVITSSVPVKDIILYIQNELLQGNPINGYIRKEMWGEQRGGLCPHPDAQPIRVRDDGTFIYSPDDLGYDPETGAMGCSKEERGTYAGIPIGSPVKIIAVDPQSRMIKGDFQLDGEPPNHSHIHVWISLKDIDLI